MNEYVLAGLCFLSLALLGVAWGMWAAERHRKRERAAIRRLLHEEKARADKQSPKRRN